MRRVALSLAWFGGVSVFLSANAALITVTTTNNVSPATGETSLAQALAKIADGDEIRFNIPGPGPHYIATPPEGYPQIKKNNVTIDGYSQPGSAPNTNPILAPNNAKIRIFLDSRGGGRTVLDYDGYGTSESAILGVVGGTNFTVRGVGFLGRLIVDTTDADPALYCVSFAAKATEGRVSGCWMGVDADGKTVAGANAGVTGFRFREGADAFLSDNIVVGVPARSTNAAADFNVIVGMKIPVIVEGANLRITGNFIGVLPSGTNDYNLALADLPNEGGIQVGRHGGGTLIGTDGDGVNDENERNIFAGVIPRTIEKFKANGYSHVIEFYGGGPRTNVVIAGNYFGVGIDGQTRFTNGVPLVSGQTATTRIGSDFDAKSDAVEGNLIFNNYPSSLITADVLVRDFLDGLGQDALVSLRGNKLVNNFVPPVSPLRNNGAFMTNYYAKALLDPDQGIAPVLATNSTATRLIGTVPVADTNIFPATIVDVYLPDAEGLASRVPELPGGFIQGTAYLASYVEGSGMDLNPKPGEFEFDISKLNLAVGTGVTVTANFSQEPAGTHNAVTLTSLFSGVVQLSKPTQVTPPTRPRLVVARDGNNLTITWDGSGFTLQSAADVTGPWTKETTTTNSFKTSIGPGTKFYRLTSQ
ncbi:MAG: hypothetical protein HYY23_00580 [Verrucomicrobia bacterium]|nr:hypothetical protein [Verrucomicrobiota bacterium]